MKFEGQLVKMITENDRPIRYYLNLSDDLIYMNDLFGRELTIRHTGYQCLSCELDVPLFRMGFCKKCFYESPMASSAILRPELSRAHLGEEDRDLAYEQEFQLKPHIVYLAYTGDVKVGVTRETQIPTRWIDQGATFALPIARTTNRYEAGQIEVEMKKHLPDKTNYRKMLQTLESDVDLMDFRNQIREYFPDESAAFYSHEEELWRLDYPYEAPDQCTVLTLQKNPTISGVLRGIKGQYLSFEGGNFLNVRAHEGCRIELEL
ncbi:MAG: DUF2797 domain-containing protein [Chryseobacterium sp.]|nr:MAG: DUF2797 domain-containing protein [Chryseobacterium sp.]